MVFLVLILLMGVINVLMSITSPKPKTDKASSNTTSVTASNSAQSSLKDSMPLAPGSAGEVKLYDTDPRDAAMIMAIVADELQKPLNELRFISIREVKR